ncbi:MAG: biopolymer transporter ExbD [Myxococcales bacterium]|nr:biopolymer transporter ExbD [Myxococcales bacterium]MCB9524998.1 biopolymer transporter ExbD [Myxococcales bacterium]
MSWRNKKTVDDTIEDLNLVPIMNMVVCLIPMVLAGTALIKVGVVNVNAPKFGQGAATPDETDEKPLNLTVAVGDDGFRLTATGADINQVLGIDPAMAAAAAQPADPTQPPKEGAFIPKKGEEYDYVDLYNKMVKVKSQFPQETVMNLTADARVPFKLLVNVMDALRVKLEQDTYGDLAGFKSASARIEEGAPALLWPDVVFAVAQ